jgi:hypothetical protein
MTSLGAYGYAQIGDSMGANTRVTAAFERQLVPEIHLPDLRQPEAADQRLEISVVFTSQEAALTALRRAAELAGSLSARITLIVPQIVPFPLPLASPPVLLDFQEARLREIASKSPVETVVRIYLCRDRWDVLSTALTPHSLVVLGSQRKWSWFRSESRLARRLRKTGHEVIVAEWE